MRVNGFRDRICGQNSVCDRTFAADIEHHAQVFDTFRAQRTAGAQIAMLCLVVQKPLHDRCRQLAHRQITQFRENMFIHIVAVMLVAARFRHGLDVCFEPLLRPFVQRHTVFTLNV